MKSYKLKALNGAMICGVSSQSLEIVSILAESFSGKTYKITVSGKDNRSIEKIFIDIYADSMLIAKIYYEEMLVIAEKYYSLINKRDADENKLVAVSKKLTFEEIIASDDPSYRAFLDIGINRSKNRKRKRLFAALRPRKKLLIRNTII